MHPHSTQRIQRRLGAQPNDAVAAALRRIRVQIDFAARFAAYRKDAGGQASAAQAEGLVVAFRGDVDSLPGLVAQVEEVLAPVGAEAKKTVIHCVGHGHIDMNWMWSWPETVATTHDTFASVLSLMRQYPQLTYSQSQASVYALIEKYHPEMFAEIQQRVKEGRWEVTAVHWVEGDKNLVHGESLARHLLYTRRFFQEKFGLAPEDVPVDWEPDTFGHANTVPGILVQGAVQFYYSCRTGGGHHHPRVGEDRPPLFWWEGPDGSRVLVNRETTWYNSYVNIGDNIALPAVDFFEATGLGEWLNIYGIGNHGGGPTHEEIEWMLELQTYPIYPEVRFSTATAFYRNILRAADSGAIQVPVIDHELNYEFTGCYTSQSAIKRANRLGEQYCLEAETLAALQGRDVRGLMREAWLPVLFNQFHDILPGSGVTATREHATALFQEVGAITGSIKREALKDLGEKIDTLSLLPDTPEGDEERDRLLNHPFEAGAGLGAGLDGFSISSGGGSRFRPVLVYNPCAWKRTEIVSVDLFDLAIDPGLVVARDETGKLYPTMCVHRGHPGADWGHTRYTFLVPAVDVPALGYKTLLLMEGVANAGIPDVQIESETRFQAGDLTVELDRYESGVSVSDGRLPESESWGPQLRWATTLEKPRGMTAWVFGGENTDACQPKPLPADHYWAAGSHRNQGTDLPGGRSFAYAIRQELSVPGTESKVTVHGVIQALSPRVEFSADIDWREIGTQERGIPGLELQLFTPEWHVRRFETPFGSVDREECLGSSVPTLRYTHVASTEGAVTYLQDWAYTWRDDPYEPSIKVIRSSFDPDHAPEVLKSTLRYGIVFHEEEQPPSELTRLGAAFQHKLIVTPVTLQAGTLPPAKSYAEVLTPNVVLTSLKQAEDGDGIVLRLVEYDGQDTVAAVRLDPSLPQSQAETLDLIERSVGDAASLADGVLSVPVKANSFVTVRLR